ncbi:transglutaminase domain-containing protein [bacterium]|nr:transglutaminase domain-containing protein [bacterium]
MDLVRFLARGFGEKEDKLTANVPVRGIDRYHTFSQIRLAPETAKYLYEEYTSLKVKYYKGSRPKMEKILFEICGKARKPSKENIFKILQWVAMNIKHAKFVKGDTPGDRALSEEELILSGWGWCNEKARIFVTLAQIAGCPARMCCLFHKDGIHAHMTAEVYVEGKWSFVDPSYGTVVELPDGSWASAKEISLEKTAATCADKAYTVFVKKIFDKFGGKIDPNHWSISDFPHRMLAQIGITNYPIFTIPVDDIILTKNCNAPLMSCRG